jgi:hypothetical protein
VNRHDAVCTDLRSRLPSTTVGIRVSAASGTYRNRLWRQVDNPALVDIVVKTQQPGRMALSDMDNSAASGRMRAHHYSNNARRRAHALPSPIPTCTTRAGRIGARPSQHMQYRGDSRRRAPHAFCAQPQAMRLEPIFPDAAFAAV